METVLVVGATGNIGTSAIIGALRSGRKVLAIVRNDSSAAKLFRNLATKEGVTTVQADVTSENGVRSVVEQVKAGRLPAFQHVYCCGEYLAHFPEDRRWMLTSDSWRKLRSDDLARDEYEGDEGGHEH